MESVWFMTDESPHENEPWEAGLSLSGVYSSLEAAIQDLALQKISEERFAQLLWRQSADNPDFYEAYGLDGYLAYIIGKVTVQHLDTNEPSIEIPPDRFATGLLAFQQLWDRLVGNCQAPSS